MNVEKKVIKHNLSVLELAEALGDGSVVCWQRSVSRTLSTNKSVDYNC